MLIDSSSSSSAAAAAVAVAVAVEDDGDAKLMGPVLRGREKRGFLGLARNGGGCGDDDDDGIGRRGLGMRGGGENEIEQRAAMDGGKVTVGRASVAVRETDGLESYPIR